MKYEERTELVRSHIRLPVMRQRGLPTKGELAEGGLHWQEFVEPELDWYDGSIRAMDAEIGRLLETLDRLGIEERTLMAFTSDHGEEFLEHGRHWHGVTVYGEITNVPPILWAPGRIPAGLVLEPTVQTIDVMPTLLELSGLPVPEILQGQSLVSLLSDEPGVRWRPRPAVSERTPSTGWSVSSSGSPATLSAPLLRPTSPDDII